MKFQPLRNILAVVAHIVTAPCTQAGFDVSGATAQRSQRRHRATRLVKEFGVTILWTIRFIPTAKNGASIIVNSLSTVWPLVDNN